MNVEIVLLIHTIDWISGNHYVQLPYITQLDSDSRIKYILEAAFAKSCDVWPTFAQFNLLSIKHKDSNVQIIYTCNIPYNTNVYDNVWYDVNNPMFKDYQHEISQIIRG